MKTKMTTPIAQTHSFSVERNARRITAIVDLLQVGGPSAVTGLVVAAIIRETVNRVLRARAFAHIVEKTLQSMLAVFAEAPAIANGNAAFAVIGEHGIGCFMTSGNHRIPTEIKRAFGEAVSMPHPVLSHFFKAAAATLRDAANELSSLNWFLGSAVATHNPIATSFFVDVRKTENDPPAESPVGQIFNMRRCFCYGGAI